MKASTTSIPGPHDIVRQEMDNGIIILVRENHTSPTVIIEGLLHAGAIHTPADKAGLARFTAAALMRGAGRRSFAKIFEEIESVGASLSFSAGQHTTEFGGQCLAEDSELLFDIIQDALFSPTFPTEQLEKLRGQIITSLQIQSHDTRRVAGREFSRLAYPSEHPYSRSAYGTEETVSTITRDDILAFHRENYGPAGTILSIVGDVKAETIIDKLTKRLAGWKPAPGKPIALQVADAPRPDTTRENFVPVAGKTQSDILWGIPGPRRAAPDFMHARLANTILGVFGMMGRLGATVREAQGLAYYAYSELRGGLGPGPWLVNAGVNPANVARAISSIRDEVRRLQNDLVDDEELADNKSFMIGSLPIHLETNEGVAGTILDMELYQLGMDYLQRYPETIASVTAEQVQAAAQKHLDPDLYALAVAGPPPQ